MNECCWISLNSRQTSCSLSFCSQMQCGNEQTSCGKTGWCHWIRQQIVSGWTQDCLASSLTSVPRYCTGCRILGNHLQLSRNVSLQYYCLLLQATILFFSSKSGSRVIPACSLTITSEKEELKLKQDHHLMHRWWKITYHITTSYNQMDFILHTTNFEKKKKGWQKIQPVWRPGRTDDRWTILKLKFILFNPARPVKRLNTQESASLGVRSRWA
jgi:hypothetical protein